MRARRGGHRGANHDPKGTSVPDVHSEIVIGFPPQRVYELAKNVESFPEFLPNVQRVTIREREGPRTVSEWVGLVPEFRRTIRWVEEDLWDDGGLRCRFRSLSGDWDRYEGTWVFAREGEGTRVSLDISYDYNVPLIGPLIQKLLRKLVARNADETLEGLRRRAAGEV
jgi:ribosome-associated toxin RatA of RatAB toxin-antitoxin module